MKYICLSAFTLFIIATACNKKEFLNEKANQSHLVPTSLAELQAVLDKDLEMNGMSNAGRGPVPNLGEVAAGDFYNLDSDYKNRLNSQFQKYYHWEKDIYDGSREIESWKWPYQVVFYANVVLDGLNKIEKIDKNKEEFEHIMGSALFSRAHAYYQLAQVFAPPYQFGKENAEWGIILRESSDLNEELSRSTVKETYDKIIEDLEQVTSLLNENVKLKTRPSKQAAYGLLARVYLSMQEYGKAGLYADSCLRIQNELLDYNDLNPNLTYPFTEVSIAHKEVLFSCNMVSPNAQPLNIVLLKFEDDLVNMFHEDDLRKQLFFNKTPTGVRYKGYYYSGGIPFAGVAIDEIYLIRAECNARKGNIDKAMDDLNLLIKSRWNNDATYVPFAADNTKDALAIVFLERRKQLLLRGLRWTDLRRLNLEGAEITLERTIDNEKYVLPPNDSRYTYPIPPEVIGFYTNMPQNTR